MTLSRSVSLSRSLSLHLRFHGGLVARLWVAALGFSLVEARDVSVRRIARVITLPRAARLIGHELRYLCQRMDRVGGCTSGGSYKHARVCVCGGGEAIWGRTREGDKERVTERDRREERDVKTHHAPLVGFVERVRRRVPLRPHPADVSRAVGHLDDAANEGPYVVRQSFPWVRAQVVDGGPIVRVGPEGLGGRGGWPHYLR